MSIDQNLLIAAKLIHDECDKNICCNKCQLCDICFDTCPNRWNIPDPPPEPTERQRIEWLRMLPDEEMLKAMDTFSLIYDCKEFNCFFTGHKTWCHKVVTLEQFRKDVGLE